MSLNRLIGNEIDQINDIGGEIFGFGNKVGALREEGGEIGVVGEEVGSDGGFDAEGVGVEAGDEEAEIRGGERRGG